MNFDELKTIPKRELFTLLGLVVGAEFLLMVTIDAALEKEGYLNLVRAVLDAGLLAIICIPLLINYQLRPMRAAYYDDLTGLPNRLLFCDRLEQVLASAKREQRNCAVVFVDLDKFKSVNDGYGHRVGDVLLKCAAERMWKAVRRSDTVARIGGDEFIILLPFISKPEDVEKVVGKIIGEFSLPFDLDGRMIQIGISAGVALYPRDGNEGLVLINAADEAMYRAKAVGGSGYCFTTH
ncbi:MAG: GGDEF domain-containing protein [Gallionella sp.]|nr:GGDEF domain-containing protein [Gallionella sp.]